MAKPDQYTAKEFIKAIKGSGGVISTIADRVGCNWHTAKKYLTQYTTVQQAWEAEKESTDDLAESVIINNIILAHKMQKQNKIADTSDSRWWIERRRRDKFSTKQQIEQTQINIDWDSLTDDQLRRLADGENPLNVISTPNTG